MKTKNEGLKKDLKESATQVEDFRLSEKKNIKQMKEKEKEIHNLKTELVRVSEIQGKEAKEIAT